MLFRLLPLWRAPTGRYALFRFRQRLLLLICVGLSVTVFAQDNSSAQDSTSVIDNVHELVNRRFIDLVGDVDGFFGGEDSQGRGNRSWARLRLRLTKLESENPDLQGNIKLKLVLPNTEKRLQLLLSTEDEDNLDPGEARGRSLSANADDNVSLALRFLQSVKRESSFKLDLGARVRDDVGQAFVRFSGSRKFIASDDEEKRDLILINNLWYFTESGYENRLNLVYRQTLGLPYLDFFQSASEATWRANERDAVFVQSVGVFHKLNERTFFGLEGILDAVSSPEPGEKRARAFEARWRIRQNIWWDWFYYEVIPRVRWEAERDFSVRYGIQLQVEAFFGSLGDRVTASR